VIYYIYKIEGHDLTISKEVIILDRCIELGKLEDGTIVLFDASDIKADISLSSILSILLPIFIGTGLQALSKFITTGEFGLKYPGGRLRFLYNFIKDKNPKKHRLDLTFDNELL